MKNTIIFLSIISVLAFGCKMRDSESSGAGGTGNDSTIILSADQVNSIGIRFVRFQKINIPEIIFANGYIEVPPQNLVRISPMISGYVTRIEFLEGQFVNPGQAILRISSKEAIDLQQRYLELVSEYKYLEDEYLRQKSLSEENINARKVFLQAEAGFLGCKAGLEATRKKLMLSGINLSTLEAGEILSELNIKSPIRGYITSLDVIVGQHVNPDETLFEVTDAGHLHAVLNVFEKDAARIKKGQSFKLKIAGINAGIDGSIFLVNRKLDEEKRTVRIHGDFAAVEGILPGMYAQAEIYADEYSAWVLPTEAILKGERETWIFKKTDDTGGVRFDPAKINTGREFGEFTEIIAEGGQAPDSVQEYAMHELYYLRSLLPGK